MTRAGRLTYGLLGSLLLGLVFCASASAQTSCTPRSPYHDNCSDPWLQVAGLAAAGIVVPPHLAASVVWGHNNFQSACRRHDHCYHHGYCSYGKSKRQCDQDFLSDMRSICDNLGFFRTLEIPLCREAAFLFHEGVDRSSQAASAYLGSSGYFSCYEGGGGTGACATVTPPAISIFLPAWW